MVCVGTGAAGVVGVVLPARGAGCDVGGGVDGRGAVARVRCAAAQLANVKTRNSAKIRLIIGNSINFCGFAAALSLSLNLCGEGCYTANAVLGGWR